MNEDFLKFQLEGRGIDNGSAVGRTNDTRDEKIYGDDGPNKISEAILKCLLNIFTRMSSTKSRSTADALPSLSSFKMFEGTEFKDPYGIFFEFGQRDIGPYKDLFAIEATSVNPNRTSNSVFLIRRLK